MSLDHYVSQVHLKNFYSPALGKRMYATGKWSLETYLCDAASQCRIKNGSTNEYLEEPRAVEAFLKGIEPKYNLALNGIRNHEMDRDIIFTIAGFAAYVDGCSPGAVRIFKKTIENQVEAMGSLIAEKNKDGGQPNLATIDFGDPLNKVVRSIVDRKYAQSFGINFIMRRIYLWGNSTWEIFLNDQKRSPFFTSDFPIAIITSDNDQRFKDKIIPLAPDVAVRIRTNIDYQYDGNHRFTTFRYKFLQATKKDVLMINQAIIRCAESTVYYRDRSKWILPFIEKNRFFRMEPKIVHAPLGTRDFMISTVDVANYSPLL